MSIGETISHYRVVAKLGQGGMGVVYRAEDVRLGRPVALKMLSPLLASDVAARRRFAAEARAASALDHPNICALYDVGETSDGSMFLALAFCEGETLQTVIARGPIDPARALDTAAQIADGLAVAHAKGIVHRDIKPGNVMLRPDGLVKILDFGVAKLEGDAGITAPTDSIGSPAYMAPEQIRNRQPGSGVDLWALGVLLFEMIAGRRPFEGDVHGVLYAVLNLEPPLLHDLRPGVHPEISRIVAHALAKDPGDRYASATELARDLRAVANASSTETRISSTTPAPAAAQATPAQPSLAVLPFADLSPTRDQDWFCEGLAEELITALSGVRGLRVASRASTLQFRDQDPRAIGEKLQVETLLTGGVRKAGTRLRITTQLVRVADGSVLASSRYDHDLEDVFALQEAIATATVEIVVSRMGEQITGPRVRRPTDDIEAYNLYLKGRFHWNRRSAEGFRTAIPLFEQAIEKDPGFALAYAGLADVFAQLAFFGAARPLDLAERGKELCRKALELDPDLVEARTILASYHAVFDWDWDRAESQLRRVLERSPTHAATHQALAMYVLTPHGRFDEAIAEMEAAVALDPVSIPLNISLGFALYFARRVEEARSQLEATLEIDPSYSLTRMFLSETLVALGRTDEGIEVLAPTRTDPNPGTRSALGFCFARAGRIDEARAILADLMQPPGGTYVTPIYPAVVLIGLGDAEQALDLFERAVFERLPQVVFAGVRPQLDPLRGHPRFQRILDHLRLPNLRPH